jgi:hypothetical protein
MIHRHFFARRAAPVAFAFLLTAFCLLPSVFAQSATATLSGTIEDTNGAIIPGVAVTVTNAATAMQRKVVTSEQGYFTVPLLPPGTYTVRAEREGFAPVEARDVVLNVGDNKALQIQLKAGDVNAQVTIDSDAETVSTDGSVGTVVNRQFVANMPLSGRTLQPLIQLTPGVVLLTVSPGGATGGTQFSVNGQRTTSNYFMVDGVSANTGIATSGNDRPGAGGSGQVPGTTALGGMNSLVSLDALQEFRIETSTFAAEFGRTPGGQVSLITRGGTNDFHGNASEYFRNEALDANDWFGNANRLPKPRERQNLFGGVLGGPVYLPKLGEGGTHYISGKNRLFFFASYEGLRLEQPQVQVLTVPSLQSRSQAIPAMRPFLNAVPRPNSMDFGNGSAQFGASYSNPGSFNIFALRLDGHIIDRLTAFFRFSHAPSEASSRTLSLSTISRVEAVNNSYTGGVTWVVGSQFSADVRMNWTRNAPRTVFELDDFGGAVVPNVSDVFASGRNPARASLRSASNNGANFSWGIGTSDVQRQFNVVGTVSSLVGTHHLKFGADYRRLLPIFGSTGNFEIANFGAAQQFIDGKMLAYVSTNSLPEPRKAIIPNLSLFAQDTWRASSRITLNYGLRFERVPSPSEADGNLPSVLLGIDHDVLDNPRIAPSGTPLFHSRVGYFAPRFGVAYQLSSRSGWETTLRGGSGIFYDLGLGDIANEFQNVYPFFIQKQRCCNLPFPLSPADRAVPILGVDPPGSIQQLDPDLRLPYTIHWNAAWEQGLGRSQTLTVSYVGAEGRRLLVRQLYFQPLAQFPTTNTIIDIQRNLGSSTYQSLQLQFQRRLRRGLQVLASYTLGKSRDNVSAQDDSTAPPASRSELFDGSFGPSSFDVRHVLSAAVTYDLPKPSGPQLIQVLTRNWGVDLLIRYQSAFPFNVSTSAVSLGDGTTFRPRPDLVVGQPLYIQDSSLPGGRRANAAAFVQPPCCRQGNFPRNGLRGFPASQADLAVRREFSFGERVRLQLRGEFFNVFNHPSFGAPQTFLPDSNFGKPSQMLNRSLGGLNGLYQMGGPRSGQLAVKVLW